MRWLIFLEGVSAEGGLKRVQKACAVRPSPMKVRRNFFVGRESGARVILLALGERPRLDKPPRYRGDVETLTNQVRNFEAQRTALQKR